MPSVGLIGFERSGKTTLFNALTGAARPTGFTTHVDPQEGVVPAADERLMRLSALYHPRKTTPATLDVVDFPVRGSRARWAAARRRARACSTNSRSSTG